MAEIIKITSDNFQNTVIQNDKTVVIDLWAAWCGPCRMFSPVFEKCADEMPLIQFGKMNIDEEPELASSIRVMSIPTVLIYKNGEIAKKISGAVSLSELKRTIEEL